MQVMFPDVCTSNRRWAGVTRQKRTVVAVDHSFRLIIILYPVFNGFQWSSHGDLDCLRALLNCRTSFELIIYATNIRVGTVHKSLPVLDLQATQTQAHSGAEANADAPLQWHTGKSLHYGAKSPALPAAGHA